MYHFSLVDATASTFSSDRPYFIELDEYNAGEMIYIHEIALKSTSAGATATIIAGNVNEQAFKNGAASVARFDRPEGFTKTSSICIVVSDTYNKCVRVINLADMGNTVANFSGRCGSQGDKDGLDGKFKRPKAIILDKKNSNQLFVSDDNQALRTIVISTGEIGTFTETGNALLRLVNYMTQHEDGDIFVSAHLSISRVSYEDKSVKKIVGVKSVRNDGDEVGLFSEALFSYPAGLQFIGKNALLMADEQNSKVKLIDLKEKEVSYVDVCSGCGSMGKPSGLVCKDGALYLSFGYKNII